MIDQRRAGGGDITDEQQVGFCVAHRCDLHVGVQAFNRASPYGAECGACVAAAFVNRLRNAATLWIGAFMLLPVFAVLGGAYALGFFVAKGRVTHFTAWVIAAAALAFVAVPGLIRLVRRATAEGDR